MTKNTPLEVENTPFTSKSTLFKILLTTRSTEKCLL